MPKQHQSRSSIRTQSHPLCTAVKGCEQNASQLSYELPGGKRARICAMHLQRLRRSGKLGGPGTVYSMATKRKDREVALLAHLRRLRGAAGTEWKAVTDGRGSC